MDCGILKEKINDRANNQKKGLIMNSEIFRTKEEKAYLAACIKAGSDATKLGLSGDERVTFICSEVAMAEAAMTAVDTDPDMPDYSSCSFFGGNFCASLAG
jgi:hypothetical protein